MKEILFLQRKRETERDRDRERVRERERERERERKGGSLFLPVFALVHLHVHDTCVYVLTVCLRCVHVVTCKLMIVKIQKNNCQKLREKLSHTNTQCSDTLKPLRARHTQLKTITNMIKETITGLQAKNIIKLEKLLHSHYMQYGTSSYTKLQAKHKHRHTHTHNV